MTITPYGPAQDVHVVKVNNVFAPDNLNLLWSEDRTHV